MSRFPPSRKEDVNERRTISKEEPGRTSHEPGPLRSGKLAFAANNGFGCGCAALSFLAAILILCSDLTARGEWGADNLKNRRLKSRPGIPVINSYSKADRYYCSAPLASSRGKPEPNNQ
jgi:hypothetical protein